MIGTRRLFRNRKRMSQRSVQSRAESNRAARVSKTISDWTGATTTGDRDARELMIALTAIVVAWSIAGALTLGSAVLFEHQTTSREDWIGDQVVHQAAP
jgi:hypothetical protein